MFDGWKSQQWQLSHLTSWLLTSAWPPAWPRWRWVWRRQFCPTAQQVNLLLWCHFGRWQQRPLCFRSTLLSSSPSLLGCSRCPSVEQFFHQFAIERELQLWRESDGRFFQIHSKGKEKLWGCHWGNRVYGRVGFSSTWKQMIRLVGRHNWESQPPHDQVASGDLKPAGMQSQHSNSTDWHNAQCKD